MHMHDLSITCLEAEDCTCLICPVTPQGELDGWAEMVSASGTFQGPMGTCGGPAAAAA
jgi:hypothetical protein